MEFLCGKMSCENSTNIFVLIIVYLEALKGDEKFAKYFANSHGSVPIFEMHSLTES